MLKKILISLGIAAAVMLLLWAGLTQFGTWRAAPPHKGITALVNGHFLTMAGDAPEIIRDQVLLIEDAGIRGFVSGDAVPDGARIIDLNGGYAMPGLFDLHVHFGGMPFADGRSFAGMMVQFFSRLPRRPPSVSGTRGHLGYFPRRQLSADSGDARPCCRR